MRLYSLLESNLDIDQFLKSIHRYIHIGIHVKGYMSKKLGRFQREIVEVAEFYVDDTTNEAKVNVIYRKGLDGSEVYTNPSKYLIEYLSMQGVEIPSDTFVDENGNYSPKIIQVAPDIKPAEGTSTQVTGTTTATSSVAPVVNAAPVQPQVKEAVQQTPVVNEVKPVEHMIEPIVLPKQEVKEEIKEPEKVSLEDEKASLDMGSIVNPNANFQVIEEKKEEVTPSVQVVNNVVPPVNQSVTPVTQAVPGAMPQQKPKVMDSTPVFNINQ